MGQPRFGFCDMTSFRSNCLFEYIFSQGKRENIRKKCDIPFIAILDSPCNVSSHWFSVHYVQIMIMIHLFIVCL